MSKVEIGYGKARYIANSLNARPDLKGVFTVSAENHQIIHEPEQDLTSHEAQLTIVREICKTARIIDIESLEDIYVMDIPETLKDLMLGIIVFVEEEYGSDAQITSDLGADSLDEIEIVMAVENEFDIEINDEEVEDLKTPGQYLDHIEKALEL